tara:strand:- start:4514 stop:4678 length:165 start_codon:yes stop_codon:yes gene_type:complete
MVKLNKNTFMGKSKKLWKKSKHFLSKQNDSPFSGYIIQPIENEIEADTDIATRS